MGGGGGENWSGREIVWEGNSLLFPDKIKRTGTDGRGRCPSHAWCQLSWWLSEEEKKWQRPPPPPHTHTDVDGLYVYCDKHDVDADEFAEVVPWYFGFEKKSKTFWKASGLSCASLCCWHRLVELIYHTASGLEDIDIVSSTNRLVPQLVMYTGFYFYVMVFEIFCAFLLEKSLRQADQSAII